MVHSKPVCNVPLWVGLAFLGLSIGVAASSAQLLDNSTFDNDVSGWIPAGDSTLAWDPFDAQGSPFSGSAFVANLSSTEVDSTGAYQCADGIVETSSYAVDAEVLIPGGQTESGLVNIVVLWYADPGCFTLLDLSISSTVLTSTPDLWLPVSGWLTAPAGSQSARIWLNVLKVEDTGSLVAHFDNVSLAEGIFTDGFESGDTAAWSYSTICPECPIADFTFVTNGLTVTFFNTSTGDPPLSYLWDFGDGTQPPNRFDQNPVHQYSGPGSFNVTMTVFNSIGSDSITKPVTVSQ